MVRLAAKTLVLLVALAGCATHNQAKSPQHASAGDHAFANEEQKILACLDLRDHIVALYADQYVVEQGLAMSPQERTAFRDGWAEELAKKGTFDRFEQSCFYSLTPTRYRCGMASQTTDGLEACMKLSAR
jgi:sugar lactone lactonase YvrE